MFSYIFMKILESRARRYDIGINILSGGHAGKVRKRIIRAHVKKGIRMLDVGCGTGSLVLESSRAGAEAYGLDISRSMLDIARKKAEKMEATPSFLRASVAEMDGLFESECFDLITSTFVLSELYPDERRWALDRMHGMLKKDGKLVIAAEVLPGNPFKRLLYRLVRFHLAFITNLIAQTGTRPIHDPKGELAGSGFEIVDEKHSFLDGFVLITAGKTDRKDERDEKKSRVKMDRISPLKSIWDFAGRWFPNPVEPGLRIIGKPDRSSPVLATANFHLTVRRVERSLKGISCYLLVAPTGGINVWCGSAGGEMTEHSIISVIKTSGISEMVDHRKVVLPLLGASGIDRRILEEHTGWHGEFGPAYARDIPDFLGTGKLDKGNTTTRFPLRFGLEMLLSMNFLVWLIAAAVILVIDPMTSLVFSALFWGAGLMLYAGYHLIPGRSGWLKSIIIASIITSCIASFQMYQLHNVTLSGIKWIIASIAVCLWLGFDLKGIVSGGTSEAVRLLHRLNIGSFGKLHKASGRESGSLHFDENACIVCGTCVIICPVNVFEKRKGEIFPTGRERCMRCGACVMQCPVKALEIS